MRKRSETLPFDHVITQWPGLCLGLLLSGEAVGLGGF